MTRLSRERWIILALIAGSEFIVFVDTAIVNLASPAILRSLDTSPATVAWIVNIYQVLFGGFLLLGGRVADLFAQRRVFLGAHALSVVASVMAGLAPSGPVLIVGRALQGLTAAMLVPVSLAMMVRLYTEPAEYNLAFGVWGAMRSSGAALGTLLGGLITFLLGWRWIFFMTGIVGAVILAISPFYVPTLEALERRELDVGGAVSVTAGLLLVSYATLRATSLTGSTLELAGAVGLGLLFLAVFVLTERVRDQPLVDLDLFSRPNLTGGTVVGIFLGASHVPAFYLLSFYLQAVVGYNPLEAAAAILPIGLGVMVISTLLVPRFLDQYGFRDLLVGSLLLLAAGEAILAIAPTANAYVQVVLPASVLLAFGIPGSLVGTRIAGDSAVGEEQKGFSAGLINAGERIGSGLGAAILTALVVWRAGALEATGNPGLLASGYRAGFAGAALLTLAAAGVAFVVISDTGITRVDSESPEHKTYGD